jgi:Sulfotransferase family
MYFPELAQLQPHSRFVLVVRDPRDTVASMRVVAERAASAGAPPPMSDMADGTKGTATLFLKYYANVIASGLMRDPRRLLTVRYEDLVTNPKEWVARLSLWSGLDISPDAIERPNAGDDGSIFGAGLYGEKISDTGIGRFARRLSTDEVAATEEIARGFMEFYGYRPRPAA